LTTIQVIISWLNFQFIVLFAQNLSRPMNISTELEYRILACKVHLT